MSTPEPYYSATITHVDQGAEVMKRAAAVARAEIDNGNAVRIMVCPGVEPVRLRQHRFYRGPVLQQIAEQVVMPDGARYTTDVWHEFFARKFLAHYEMMRRPGYKRAVPVRVIDSTADLGVKAMSEFSNRVIDDAVMEYGVAFVFKDEDQSFVVKKRPTVGNTDQAAIGYDGGDGA